MSSEKQTEGTILLLDALALRRESIRSLLEPWSASIAFDFVGIPPENLPETAAQRGRIKLVVLVVGGMSLDKQDQQDAMARVKETLPDTPCVVLSDSREPEEAICAARSGMQAFLTSAMQPAIVSQALAFVLGGGSYFPREALLAPRSGGGYPHAGAERVADVACAGLTIRQNEVVERLRYGKSNKVIARELNMQEATVKVHVRQIMRKLGAANRTQVALLAQVSAHPALRPAGDREMNGLPSAVIVAQSAYPPATMGHDIRPDGG